MKKYLKIVHTASKYFKIVHIYATYLKYVNQRLQIMIWF